MLIVHCGATALLILHAHLEWIVKRVVVVYATRRRLSVHELIHVDCELSTPLLIALGTLATTAHIASHAIIIVVIISYLELTNLILTLVYSTNLLLLVMVTVFSVSLSKLCGQSLVGFGVVQARPRRFVLF